MSCFNTMIRRVFKLSRYASVRDLIECIGAEPSNILLDKGAFFAVNVTFIK